MSRSFRHNPDEQPETDNPDEQPNKYKDNSRLSATDSVSTNSAATGDLSVSRQLSSRSTRDKKRADKQFRKQRRGDERQ